MALLVCVVATSPTKLANASPFGLLCLCQVYIPCLRTHSLKLNTSRCESVKMYQNDVVSIWHLDLSALFTTIFRQP